MSQNGDFEVYNGNCPRNVKKDAKLSIKKINGEWVVGTVYQRDIDERWHPFDNNHDALVERVNAAKSELNGTPGGSFYINEFEQVIVPPVNSCGYYYLIGEYTNSLKFCVDGEILSGDCYKRNGKAYHQRGDEWEGLHHGIPYIITAHADDIYYKKIESDGITETKVKLSKYQDKRVVQKICRMIAEQKGDEGGKFYINEYRQLFYPKTEQNITNYYYIGELENLSDWFPKPNCSE